MVTSQLLPLELVLIATILGLLYVVLADSGPAIVRAQAARLALVVLLAQTAGAALVLQHAPPSATALEGAVQVFESGPIESGGFAVD